VFPKKGVNGREPSEDRQETKGIGTAPSLLKTFAMANRGEGSPSSVGIVGSGFEWVFAGKGIPEGNCQFLKRYGGFFLFIQDVFQQKRSLECFGGKSIVP